MIAVNIVRQSGALHMITDGAMYRPVDGIMLAAIQKVFPLVHLKAAVASRGNPGGQSFGNMSLRQLAHPL